MAGPWEQFAPQEAAPAADGPWAKFAPAAAERGVADKLLGLTGERFQTWPERAVRSVMGIPEKAITAAASAPAGSREATENMSGPAAEAALASAGALGTLRTGVAKAVVPTTEQLMAAGSAGYNEARNMGLKITSESVGALSDNIASNLEKIGLNADLAPDTFKTLARMRSAPEGSYADVSNLETIRATLREAAQNYANPREQKAASRAINALDDHLATIPSRDVLAGDANAAREVLARARGNYAAGSRSQQLDDAAYLADLNAGAANSGKNVNTDRQTIKSILRSDKKTAGYSDDEIAQMERVVMGTTGGNAARTIGNLMGAGGGLGQVASSGVGAGLGAVVAGPVGAAVGGATPVAVGSIARLLAKRSTENQTNLLSEMVRKRSPLYMEQPVGSDAVQAFPYGAIVDALLQDRRRN